jgi:diguanylate cyclase (GGDEF)-like protein/PAS domain S-box-containing protein
MAIVEEVLKQKYHLESCERTLKTGKIAALFALVIISITGIQEILLLHLYNFTLSRLFGIIPSLIFIVLSVSYFKKNKAHVIIFHAISLAGVMTMAVEFIIICYSNQAFPVTYRNRVIETLMLCLFAIFIFSSGARRYIVYVVLLPMMLMVISFLFNNNMKVDYWQDLINPIIVSIVTIIMSLYQERLQYNEFRMRSEFENAEIFLDKKKDELQISEERLRLALFASHQGLYDMNLKTGNFYITAEYANMLGYDSTELDENYKSWMNRMHPDDRELVETAYRDYLNQKSDIFKSEFRQRRKDGSWVWVLSQGSVVQWDQEGLPTRMAGAQLDITERKRVEKELEEIRKSLEMANLELDRQSRTDPLTKIFNRRHFSEVFDTEWLRSIRNNSSISAVMIDIDYFKDYNDYYGHISGDNCLIAVAAAIKISIRRPPDIVARYGGEEFIVLLPDTKSDGAEIVSENIRKAIDDLKICHAASKVGSFVSISLGVSSIIPSNSIQNSILIESADNALYEAKRQGRNRVIVHHA